MTDWDDHYRRRETPWDKGAAAPPLVEWLARHPMAGDILVPGCGFGHDVRAIAGQARLIGEAKVVGFDLSPAALEVAQARPAAGGERYRVGDLVKLPDDMLGGFDWVFEHTCFCAIDPSLRSKYVEAVHSALRPSGQLLAIFYLNPYDPDETREGPPFEVSEAELDRLFDPRFKTLASFGPEQSYPGREGRELVRLLVRRG